MAPKHFSYNVVDDIYLKQIYNQVWLLGPASVLSRFPSTSDGETAAHELWKTLKLFNRGVLNAKETVDHLWTYCGLSTEKAKEWVEKISSYRGKSECKDT